MRKLIAPIVWLCIFVVSGRFVLRFAPYLAGIDTLEEQVNGTLPVGMMYIVGLESLSTIFSIAAVLCFVWLVARMIIISKENKHHD